MTEATLVPVAVPDNVAAFTTISPTFKRLAGVSALQTCDRDGEGVYAVVQIVLPSGLDLLLCGNCARKHFRYEHTAHALKEDRSKGSVH